MREIKKYNWPNCYWMAGQKLSLILLLIVTAHLQLAAQESIPPSTPENAGWFSLGGRSTFSSFSDDGSGIGTGGQFRIQLSNKVNTDWFADYIIVSNDKNVRSVYYHIGWSVLYYPFEKLHYPNSLFQPFLLAGHCFDYNKKTILSNSSINKDRWGSAVQMGIGTHLNLTSRFDLTLMTQYMIHLTKELEVEQTGGIYTIEEAPGSALEGHLLSTVSINYKLFKLWKK